MTGLLDSPEFLGALALLAMAIVAGAMVLVHWALRWRALRRFAEEVRDEAAEVRRKVDAAERDIRAGARTPWPVEMEREVHARLSGRMRQ